MTPEELKRFRQTATDVKQGAGDTPVILPEKKLGVFKGLFLKWDRWRFRRAIRAWCRGMGKLKQEFEAEKREGDKR